MTTQYSPILKLALPVQGELSGTWGDVVNDNITSMVEQAIAGRAVINTWSTNSHSLTSANGTTSESRCAMLELTDTGTALSGAGTVICPALSKIYIVKNAAGQNITVKTASGTGILVPNGRTTFLFCDGTNVVEALTHTTSLQLGTSTTVTAVLDQDDMASDSATSLATQQSIKAYVDSKVGQFDSLAEVLAVGNTTGSNDIIVDNGQKITTNTIDETTTGSGVTIDSVLLKDDGVNATNLEVTNIKANDGTAAGSIADSTGVVTVASAVLTTADINGGTADGVVIGGTTPAAATVTTATANTSLNIAGTTTVTSILDEDNMASNDPAGLATQQSIKAYVDSQVGTVDTLAEILANGNTTGGTDLAVSAGDDITFTNSSKAIFGTGSSLEIYGDGSHSYISDQGTGNLRLLAGNFQVNTSGNDGTYIRAGNASDVELFYGGTGGTVRLATTNTGVDITGVLTSDGLTVDGVSTFHGDGNAPIAWGDTTDAGFLSFDGSGNAIVRSATGARLNFQVNANRDVLSLQNGSTIFNESGLDQDFRVESDNNSHMLFVDAGNDKIGINTSSPDAMLTVDTNIGGSSTGTLARFHASKGESDSTFLQIAATRHGTAQRVQLQAFDDDGSTGRTLALNSSGGSVGIGSNDTSGLVTIVGTGSGGYNQLTLTNNYTYNTNKITGLTTLNYQNDSVSVFQAYLSNGSNNLYLGSADSSQRGFRNIFTYTAPSSTATTGHRKITSHNYSGFVVNDDSNDVDFRVESDSNANALFVDAGNGRVGINNSSPANTLDVNGSVIGSSGFSSVTPQQTTGTPFGSTVGGGPNSTRILIVSPPSEKQSSAIKLGGGNTGGNNSSSWISSQYTGAYASDIRLWAPRLGNHTYGDTDATNVFNARESETNFYSQNEGASGTIFRTLNLNRSGGAIFNPDSHSNLDLRVASDSNTHALFVDAGNSRVGINTSGPTQALDVSGTIRASAASGTSGVYDTIAYQFSEGRGWGYNNVDDAVFYNGADGKVPFLARPQYVVINESSHDTDFRVESNNNSSMLVVDAGSDRVSIGTHNTTNGDLTIYDTGTTGGQLYLSDSTLGVNYGGFIRGKGITGSGGYLYMGTVDANTQVVGYGMSPFAQNHTFYTRSGALGDTAVRLGMSTTGLTVNEPGLDYDFRVESDSNANMLFVDAGNDSVGIGTGTVRSGALTVGSTESGVMAVLRTDLGGGNASGTTGIYLGDAGSGVVTLSREKTSINTSDTVLAGEYGFNVRDERMRLSRSYTTILVQGGQQAAKFSYGATVFNEESRDFDFRVESDSVSDMFVVDAGTNCVNIGAVGSSTTTNYSLFVRGNNKESGTNTYYVQKIGASSYQDVGGYTALIGLGVEPNAGWAKGAIGWTRTNSYDRGHMVFLNNSAASSTTSSLSDERMRITSSGVVITGSLSKSSGSFRIPHPVASKTETHDLVHSFVEAPQADNIYRGKVSLVAGQGTANIDTVAGMTEGTFAALNREIQCFTSNETGWTAVRGSVSGNILTIEAQDNTCTDTVSWLVVGERQDQHMYDTEWTDENGKVIVEPLKPVE